MKWRAKLVIAAAAPLLMAAFWMDRQQSIKPYDAPVLAPPADSVPVSGREIVTQSSVVSNFVKPTPESQAEGATLFDINCAMCHGKTSTEPGPVGRKLNPPPPGLNHELVLGLSDAFIFKAVTFGFGRMPPFRNRLTPRERWHLVNFLRTRK
jgi:mono/diheme cytochrome c family protein